MNGTIRIQGLVGAAVNDLHDVIARLQELEAFLRRHAVTGWPDTLREVRVESGEKRDVLQRRVLDMFKGTMGSLSDLIISRVNGHEVDDERAANAELDRLLDELWQRAQGL